MDTHATHTHSHAAPAGAVTRDPVCGMTVDMAKTPHRTIYEGREIGFCSGGCKAKFEADPAKYLSATDPVCGMQVDRASAKHMLKHEGTRYYFCSEGCKTKFEADPRSTSNRRRGAPRASPSRPGGAPVDPATVPEGAKWTCPMHPEIVRDGPGDCPICGMALEPMVASLDDGPNPELVDFTRRLWVSAALSRAASWCSRWATWSGCRCANGSASRWPAGSSWRSRRRWCCGRRCPFFRRFWNSLRNRSPNMWTLIGLGVGAAYLFSVVAVLFPDIFPMSMTHMGGLPPVYFEAAAVIVALVFVGQVLELRARDATGKAHPGAAQPRAEDGAADLAGPGHRSAARRGAGRATGCASGRARRCRSTARCCEGRELRR